MRPIVIQGAMEKEIEYYFEVLSSITVQSIGNHRFYHGLYEDYPVIIALTEIGMVNCSISSALAASDFFPAMMINQGIAGSHRRDLHVSDIVVGETAVAINSFEKPLAKDGVHYQYWMATDFFSQKDRLKADEELVHLFDCAEYTNGQKIRGVLGSGDVWNREWEFITWLNATRGTSCEDMESMATYQVADEFAIPVIGVRIISNNELLEEAYDPEIAVTLQKFIVAQLPKLIAFAKERE